MTDPDREDLPPGMELPERRQYARRQHWARLVVSLAGVVVLLVMLALDPGSRLLQVCTLLIAAVAMVHFVRWQRSR